MSEGALALRHADARPPLLRLLSDARLAERASAGSDAAFTAIYKRHHQAIYRYCRSLLGNDHDARDALQNTMIKAMSALEGETRKINLRPWLFRIAHNESISLVRSRPADAELDAAAGLSSPGVDMEARQRLRGLLADLDHLTERQRAALVMRELSGLEFPEIASALETSPEGAKQALYEARLALRDFERGREMSCDDVCRQISENDRRRLRGRGVRAHLKSCDDCSAFAQQMSQRKGHLAAIAPPLPVPAGLAVLEGIIGGGGGGAAALGGATIGGVSGVAAMKVGAAAIVAVGLGGAAIDVSRSSIVSEPRAGSSTGMSSEPAANRSGDTAAARSSTEQGSKGGRSTGVTTRPEAGGRDRGSGGASGAAASQDAGANAPGKPSPSTEAPAGMPPGPGGTPQGEGATLPGQGATPPGQGGTPPGLAGSSPPGQGATPPGQGGTPPGLAGSSPPGQGGTPPGLGGGLPPGQGGTLPGLGGGLPAG